MNWADVEQARLVEEVGLGQPVEYTDHEKRLIATHEAGHATVAWLVAPQRRLEVLTIIKRREALGLLAHGDREDVFTRSRSEMLAPDPDRLGRPGAPRSCSSATSRPAPAATCCTPPTSPPRWSARSA